MQNQKENKGNQDWIKIMFKKKKLTPEQKKFKNEVMKKNLKNSRASYVMMAPYLLIFFVYFYNVFV